MFAIINNQSMVKYDNICYINCSFCLPYSPGVSCLIIKVNSVSLYDTYCRINVYRFSTRSWPASSAYFLRSPMCPRGPSAENCAMLAHKWRARTQHPRARAHSGQAAVGGLEVTSAHKTQHTHSLQTIIDNKHTYLTVITVWYLLIYRRNLRLLQNSEDMSWQACG